MSRIWRWLSTIFTGPAPVVSQPPKVEQPVSVDAEKSLFPKKEWADYLWKKLDNMPVARDQFELCGKNGLTKQNWLHLFAAMAKHESNFKPSLEFKENFKNSRGEWVISTGLFQLSYESARGYGFRNITTEDLKDPYKNIDVAVAIMRKWVSTDGVVSAKSGLSWRGGARFWSVLRTGKAQATLKTLCE
jgi:hypothetical protein